MTIVSTLTTANGVTNMLTTTKTQLGGATVILPKWARSIMAVIPYAMNDTSVAAIAMITLCEVESNDANLVPFQVLPAPVGSILGTINNNVAKPEKYQMNAPVVGGEQLNIYGTCLVTPGATLTAYMGATLVVTDSPVINPDGSQAAQKRAKVGTATSTGTTATSDVAGTRYNFSGGRHITELMGVVTPAVRAAADGIAGYFKYTSNEFVGVSDVRMPITPICGGLATTDSAYIDGASRLPVDIPLAPGMGQVNIQDYVYFGLVPAGAGNFVTGVVYE